MILIEVKDESSKFLCTDCNRTISTGHNFLISKSDLPKIRISKSDEGMYYTCICGSRYELINSSNPTFKDQLKFKHVRVVESGYIL